MYKTLYYTQIFFYLKHSYNISLIDISHSFLLNLSANNPVKFYINYSKPNQASVKYLETFYSATISS